MRRALTRLTSILLAAIYFTGQIALGATAEANFWSERRRAREPKQTRLAALSHGSLPANASAILTQLPSVRQTLTADPASSAPGDDESAHVPASLKNLVTTLPASAASVQEVHTGSADKTPVILIQDVHLNAEAQENIAAVLQALATEKKIGLVGLEGAFAPLDLSPFHSQPDAAVREIADAFLRKGLISGASYVGVTARTSISFAGVDDRRRYDANVAAIRAADKRRSSSLERLNRGQNALAEKKRAAFAPALLKLDGLRAAHDRDRLGLGEYLAALTAVTGRPGENVDRFLEAYELERSLDFPRAERERNEVLRKLAECLSAAELGALLEKSVAYRSGRLSFGRFYREFRTLCGHHKIELGRTPAFESYVRYALLSDSIHAARLHEETRALENKAFAFLASDDEDRRLIAESERLAGIEKLISFSMTPADWATYRAQAGGREADLSIYESFYREADARSETIVERLLSTPATGARALVVGGFHSSHIGELLKARGVPFVVVTPKLKRADPGSATAYLSVFTREKTPLDRIFSGEKLFVCPRMVHPEDPNLGVPMEAAMASAARKINPVRVRSGGVNLTVTVPADPTDLDGYEYSRRGAWIATALTIAFQFAGSVAASYAVSYGNYLVGAAAGAPVILLMLPAMILFHQALTSNFVSNLRYVVEPAFANRGPVTLAQAEAVLKSRGFTVDATAVYWLRTSLGNVKLTDVRFDTRSLARAERGVIYLHPAWLLESSNPLGGIDKSLLLSAVAVHERIHLRLSTIPIFTGLSRFIPFVGSLVQEFIAYAAMLAPDLAARMLSDQNESTSPARIIGNPTSVEISRQDTALPNESNRRLLDEDARFHSVTVKDGNFQFDVYVAREDMERMSDQDVRARALSLLALYETAFQRFREIGGTVPLGARFSIYFSPNKTRFPYARTFIDRNHAEVFAHRFSFADSTDEARDRTLMHEIGHNLSGLVIGRGPAMNDGRTIAVEEGLADFIGGIEAPRDQIGQDGRVTGTSKFRISETQAARMRGLTQLDIEAGMDAPVDAQMGRPEIAHYRGATHHAFGREFFGAFIDVLDKTRLLEFLLRLREMPDTTDYGTEFTRAILTDMFGQDRTAAFEARLIERLRENVFSTTHGSPLIEEPAGPVEAPPEIIGLAIAGRRTAAGATPGSMGNADRGQDDEWARMWAEWEKRRAEWKSRMEAAEEFRRNVEERWRRELMRVLDSSIPPDSGDTGGLMLWLKRIAERVAGRRLGGGYNVGVAPVLENALAFALGTLGVWALWMLNFPGLEFSFTAVYVATWIAFIALHLVDRLLFPNRRNQIRDNLIAATIVAGGSLLLLSVFSSPEMLALGSWLLHAFVNYLLGRDRLGEALDFIDANRDLDRIQRGNVTVPLGRDDIIAGVRSGVIVLESSADGDRLVFAPGRVETEIPGSTYQVDTELRAILDGVNWRSPASIRGAIDALQPLIASADTLSRRGGDNTAMQRRVTATTRAVYAAAGDLEEALTYSAELAPDFEALDLLPWLERSGPDAVSETFLRWLARALKNAGAAEAPLVAQALVLISGRDRYDASMDLHEKLAEHWSDIPLTEQSRRLGAIAFRVRASALRQAPTVSQPANDVVHGREIILSTPDRRQAWLDATTLSQALAPYEKSGASLQTLISLAAVYYKDRFDTELRISFDVNDKSLALLLARMKQWADGFSALPFALTLLNPNLRILDVYDRTRASHTSGEGLLTIAITDGHAVQFHEMGHAMDPEDLIRFGEQMPFLYRRISPDALQGFARRHGLGFFPVRNDHDLLRLINVLVSQIYRRQRAAWADFTKAPNLGGGTLSWDDFIDLLQREWAARKDALARFDGDAAEKYGPLIDDHYSAAIRSAQKRRGRPIDMTARRKMMPSMMELLSIEMAPEFHGFPDDYVASHVYVFEVPPGDRARHAVVKDTRLRESHAEWFAETARRYVAGDRARLRRMDPAGFELAELIFGHIPRIPPTDLGEVELVSTGFETPLGGRILFRLREGEIYWIRSGYQKNAFVVGRGEDGTARLTGTVLEEDDPVGLIRIEERLKISLVDRVRELRARLGRPVRILHWNAGWSRLLNQLRSTFEKEGLADAVELYGYSQHSSSYWYEIAKDVTIFLGLPDQFPGTFENSFDLVLDFERPGNSDEPQIPESIRAGPLMKDAVILTDRAAAPRAAPSGTGGLMLWLKAIAEWFAGRRLGAGYDIGAGPILETLLSMAITAALLPLAQWIGIQIPMTLTTVFIFSLPIFGAMHIPDLLIFPDNKSQVGGNILRAFGLTAVVSAVLLSAGPTWFLMPVTLALHMAINATPYLWRAAARMRLSPLERLAADYREFNAAARSGRMENLPGFLRRLPSFERRTAGLNGMRESIPQKDREMLDLIVVDIVNLRQTLDATIAAGETLARQFSDGDILPWIRTLRTQNHIAMDTVIEWIERRYRRSSVRQNRPLAQAFILITSIGPYRGSRSLHTIVEERFARNSFGPQNRLLAELSFPIEEALEAGGFSSVSPMASMGRSIVNSSSIRRAAWLAAPNLQAALSPYENEGRSEIELIALCALYYQDRYNISVYSAARGASVQKLIARLKQWSFALDATPARYVRANPAFRQIDVYPATRARHHVLQGRMEISIDDGTDAMMHEFGHAIDPAFAATDTASRTDIFDHVSGEDLARFAREQGLPPVLAGTSARDRIRSISRLISHFFEGQRESWILLFRPFRLPDDVTNWDDYLRLLEEDRDLRTSALHALERVSAGLCSPLIDESYSVAAARARARRDSGVPFDPRWASDNAPAPEKTLTKASAPQLFGFGTDEALANHYMFTVPPRDAGQFPTLPGTNIRAQATEWFAEMVRMYFRHRERLRRANPESFALMELLFAGAPEVPNPPNFDVDAAGRVNPRSDAPLQERMVRGVANLGLDPAEVWDMTQAVLRGTAEYDFSFGFTSSDNTQWQARMLEEDLKQVLAAKGGDWRLVIYLGGLGEHGLEAVETLATVLRAIRNAGQNPADWKIRIVGLDATPSSIRNTEFILRSVLSFQPASGDASPSAEFLREVLNRGNMLPDRRTLDAYVRAFTDISAARPVDVRFTLQKADMRRLSDVRASRKAAEEAIGEPLEADYILERHVSYGGETNSVGSRRERMNLVAGYLMMFNNLNAFGKSGTRYLQEPSRQFGETGRTPVLPTVRVPGARLVTLLELVPDAPVAARSDRVANTGSSFHQVTDIRAAQSMTFADFLNAGFADELRQKNVNPFDKKKISGTGGLMLWLKAALSRLFGVELGERYDRYAAPVIENGLVFLLGALFALPFYLATGDALLAVRLASAAAWTLFIAGHLLDFINPDTRAQAGVNLRYAAIIAGAGLLLTLAPFGAVETAVLVAVFSTLLHLGVNSAVHDDLEDSARSLSDVLVVLSEGRRADALGLLQGLENLGIGQTASPSRAPFIRRWDRYAKDPRFFALLRRNLAGRLDRSEGLDLDLIVVMLKAIGLDSGSVSSILPAPLIGAPRVFVMKGRENAGVVMAAVLRSGLDKPTTLAVEPQDAGYYGALAAALNRAAGRRTVQVRAYANPSDVGLKGGAFRPERVSDNFLPARGDYRRVVFILSNGLMLDGEAENVLLLDQLIPRAVRRDVERLGVIARAILTAA